jgi:hypothetical protein
MATGLFLALPLHGHMTPALPLVGELVARGDTSVCCVRKPVVDATRPPRSIRFSIKRQAVLGRRLSRKNQDLTS